MTLEGLRQLIDAADGEPHRFPPTLIYSEGWMLRLVLQWFQTHEAPGHILEFQPGATWFSEALLPSPFKPRHRGDARSEARTHADGVVGHFTIGSAAKADARLLPEATQLVITEAKMHSPLSAGTRNAPTYDQAARNVACMSELLSRANVRPPQFKSLAFLVLAPQEHVDEGPIREKLTKTSIEKAVRFRAQAYLGELDPWLETWFIPTLQSIRLEAIPWEGLLAEIANSDKAAHQELTVFYQHCLQYNTSRFVPA